MIWSNEDDDWVFGFPHQESVTIDSFVYLLQCKEPIWYSTQIDVLLQFISEKKTTLQENGSLYYKQFL